MFQVPRLLCQALCSAVSPVPLSGPHLLQCECQVGGAGGGPGSGSGQGQVPGVTPDPRPQLHTALHTTHLPCPGPAVESRPSHTGVWWHLGQAAIISPIIYNTDTVIVKYINIISTYYIDIYLSTYMIRLTKAWDIYL